MSNAPQFMKALAALIILSGSMGLATTAQSQSTTSQSQTTGDQSESDTSDDTDAAASESSDDTTVQPDSSDDAELDTLLLGPWVILSADATKSPDNAELETSITRCFDGPKFEKLEVEPAAEKALPDAKSLTGDLVYYRTESGLQRIDMKSGQVVVFPEMKKVVEANNTFWAIRGETGGLTLKFADTKERGGQGQFMLENQRVYLKCGPGPDSDSDEAPKE